MGIRIQIRRDVSTSWQSVNPVLAEGELGYETDTGKLKIGDGVTPWNDLPYWGGGGTVTPGGENGSIQYNKDGNSLGGNIYFKYIESDYQILFNDNGAESLPSDKPPLSITTTRDYGAEFINPSKNSFIKVVTNSTDPFSNVAGIHLFSNTSFGVISYSNNELRLSTGNISSGKVSIQQNLSVDNYKLTIKVTTPPSDNPISNYGYIYADSNDNHLKWKISDGTIFDLCSTSSPGGENGSIQYNNNGSLGGSPNLKWDNENSELTINGSIKQTDVHAENQFYWVNRFGGNGRSGYIYLHGTLYAIDPGTGSTKIQIEGGTGFIKFFPSVSSSNIGTTSNPILFVDKDDNHIKYKYQDTLWDLTEKGEPGGNNNTIQVNYNGQFRGYDNFVYTITNRLGIGTSTPTHHVHIVGSDRVVIDENFEVYRNGNRVFAIANGFTEFSNQPISMWGVLEPSGPFGNEQGYLWVRKSDTHLMWSCNEGVFDLLEKTTPNGPDEAIQFNDDGNFAGLPNFTIDNDSTPPIMFARNSDGVLPTHSGILQVINNVTIDSEITDATYSRTASVIRRDTLNADASGGRFANFWIQNFTYGSGSLYSQYNMVCNFGIYDTSSSVSITNSYGIQITPYVKSGSITNLYGIRINSYTSGGSVVNFYPIYQDGNVGKNIFEASVGIGDYTLFNEKLYVQGNVWIRGDDSHIIHTNDDYVTDQTDSNIYFGVKAGDGYILQGLDFVKWNEVSDASYIPTPESGFGALYAYNKDLYWKDSDGNVWRLTTFREGQFEDRGFVYSIYDGATSRYILKSDSAVQYNNGIDFSNADHFLSGNAISVLPFELSTNQNYAEYRFINNYNGTDRRFSFWIMTEDAPENPNTIFFDGTLDLRMDFPGATIIGGGAFLKMKNSKFMFTDIDNPMQTDDTGVWVYSTTPNLKLEHRGGNSVSLKLKTGSTEWTFKNNIDASNALSVIYNTSEYIRIATNGNVLIGGGQNPRYDLHVLGEVKYDYSFCGKLTFTVPANTGKWVRIAQSGSSAGRNFGLFRITYQVSGYHGHKVFYVAADFNKEDYFNVNLIGGGRYSSDAIHRIRILSDDSDTYAVMYIEVYVQNYNSSSVMKVEIEQDFKSDDGWELLPIAEDGSIPNGYTEYIYELSERAFLVNVYKRPLLDVSERTVRMGGSDRHDINYALSVKGTSEFYSVNQAPNDNVVLQVENNMRVYGTSDGTDWFTYQFYDTSTDEIEALVALYNGTSPPTLRLVSRGNIQFAAGQSDVWADSPTNPATLYSDGTFRAKYFRPTSGYKSVDGSNGISTTITCTDTEIGMRYTLTFKNGLLVAVSSSTIT